MKTHAFLCLAAVYFLMAGRLSAANPAYIPQTLPPEGLSANEAVLHGLIGLNGKPAHVAFQWRALGARRWVKRTPWQKIARGQTNVSYSATLPNLLQETDYEVRAMARIGTIIRKGNVVSFRTAGPGPTAATGPAENIGVTSAMLTGTVNTAGDASTTAYFEWGFTTNYGNRVDVGLITATTEQPVQAALSGLLPDSTYHFRLVASNAAGVSLGADRTFDSLPNPSPVATTGPAENIQANSATLTGTVNTGGDPFTTAYFEWGFTTSYGNRVDVTLAAGSTEQSVQATLSALLPQSTYHFRLVASNAAGMSLGANQTFTSLPGPSPVATTGPAENVKAKAATLTGTVNTAGNPFTMAFFEWGLTTDYGNRVQVNLTGSTTEQSVQATLSGLLSQTTYHFRLMASNAAGVSLGTDQMFTSLPTATVVLTNYTEEDLRSAIESADVIRFAGDATINVTSLIDVTGTLTVDGGGNAVTMIGSGTNRFFSVRPGGHLQLIHLTLANGRSHGTNSTAPFTGHGEAAQAGAIEVEQGTLTAINCLFTNNAAIGGSGSENVFPELGNTTAVGHGGSALGGAIFARLSSISLTNCIFVNNQAFGGAGSRGTGSMPPWGFPHQSPPGYSKGGAVYLSNCVAVLVQCSLDGNRAATGSAYPGRSSGLGGGVHMEGGSSSFVDCLLTGNHAAGDGGAIYNIGGSATVNRAEMRSNVALSPGIGSGAAICSSAGALTILDTTFESNQASGGNAFVQPPSLRDWRPGQPGQGAALAILAGSSSVERCYFGGNSVRGGNGARHGSLVLRLRVEAGSGVGGAVFNAGTTEILNSTFVQNTATPGLAYFESGGDILSPDDASASQGGAIANVGGSLAIQFSTIAQNSAARGIVTNQIGEPLGAGLFSTNGPMTLGNSILAWNTIDTTNSANASGIILDAGNNLSSDSSFIFAAAGSVNNVDPLLGPLSNNGGPTLTFPLLPGSPAIDGANPSTAPAIDQRGVPRPQGPAPDIGAFERQ